MYHRQVYYLTFLANRSSELVLHHLWVGIVRVGEVCASRVAGANNKDAHGFPRMAVALQPSA